MAMIKYFSAAVILLAVETVDAAAVTDMQSIIRKQALPPLEVQAVQINEQGDSSLMQKSVSAQPDSYGDGDGDGDGDGAVSAPVCSTNTVYRGTKIGTPTKCHTLAECQELCTGDTSCTGFNWWPNKGKCKMFEGTFTKLEKPDWITIAAGYGDPSASESSGAFFSASAKCTVPVPAVGTPPISEVPPCSQCGDLVAWKCHA